MIKLSSPKIYIYARQLLRIAIGFALSASTTIFAAAASTAAEADNPEASTYAVPGGVYVLALTADQTSVTYAGKPVMIFRQHAIVGLPLSTKPGLTTLQLTEETTTQSQAGDTQRATKSLSHQFEVHPKQYTQQRITIKNQALVDPPAETLARIRTESVRQRKLYQTFSPGVDLSRGFLKPVEGITTSLFGHRRFFNDKARSPHSGLDIAADHGTPIKAAAAATVTLAGDLYFNGNTIFLDHGQGLITMYCHMSKLLVNTGDQIKQADIIGLVGATGRATGPHLHWSVSLGGTRIDPQSFLAVINQLAQP